MGMRCSARIGNSFVNYEEISKRRREFSGNEMKESLNTNKT